MNILFEILRGPWFIERGFASGYMGIANKILRGEPVLSQEKTLKIQLSNPLFGVQGADRAESDNDFSNAEAGSVAIIPVKGVMTKYGTLCEYGTADIAQILIRAADNPKIDGIVLDIDTGGGSVSSVNPLVEAIEYAKTKKGVVCYADMIASAGYYVGSYCNRIILSNDLSSAAGSIGVYTMIVDDRLFYEEQGIIIHEIYPPESDFKNKDIKDVYAGNYDTIISESLSPKAQIFQEVVKKNRGNKLDLKAEGLLNGKMFKASEAVKAGLADEIGTIGRAIKLARELTEVKKFMNIK